VIRGTFASTHRRKPDQKGAALYYRCSLQRGMVDRRKIISFLDGKEIHEIIESDADIMIKGEGF